MKKCIGFLSLFFAQLICFAQWELIYENENVGLLYDLIFTNSNNGYIVNGQNLIITTKNAGITWTIDSSYEGSDFRDVDFINPDTGLICCHPFSGAGDVLITFDGGVSWFDPGLNNGATQEVIELLPGGDVVFANVTGSFAYSFIAKDYYSYNIYSTIVDPGERIYTLTFLNADTGYLTGELVNADAYATVYKTIDGGFTWFVNDNMYGPLYSITFPSDSVGYGLGYESRVWKTIDYGESWFMLPYDFGGYVFNDMNLGIFGVYFYNDTIGYMLARYYDAERTEILRTINGGASWYPMLVNDPELTGMSGFFCASEDTCYSVSKGKIYKTTNGGGIDTTTAIHSNTNSLDFTISPTLAQNAIQIQTQQGSVIQEINTWSLLGEKMHVYFDDNLNADVTQLKNGIYFTEIYTNTAKHVVKWVKI